MMEKDLQYFTIEAPTPREALERMRRQYGQDARILTHKTVRRGGLLGLFAREAVEITGYVSQGNGSRRQDSMEEARKKILADARREQSLQLILKEIQNLKENLKEGQKPGPAPPPEQPTSAGLARIESIMRQNDFSPPFIEEIVGRVRREFSLEDLENFPLLEATVLEWIGQKVRIYPPFEASAQGPKVFILVGPTGVGKTTTIAKLAAIYGVGSNSFPAPKVRIVTIDNYRIAALRQIETYAEIMRIPVSCVESGAEFKKFLAMAVDTNLVLVDTIGRSPRDLSKLAEMKEVLDAASSTGCTSEIHLAVSATTKSSDVQEILQQFEPFKYRAVILTKLDETLRIGNIISVLAAGGKPISYIADGQSVPQDIEPASVLRLLMNLEGFHCNRERMEKLFGKRMKINEAYWS
jgi:flagellar biosynthesis protein FlhF